MRNRIISLFLVFVFLFFAFPKPKVEAAGAEVALAAAAAYMVASASGMTFTFTGAAGTAQEYMQKQLNTWLDDRSITDVFGAQIAKKVATKMIIPVTAYNAIKEFLNDFKTNKKIDGTDRTIGGGTEGYETDVTYDEIEIGGFKALEYGLTTEGTTEGYSKVYFTYSLNGTTYTVKTGEWPTNKVQALGFDIFMEGTTRVNFRGVWRNQYGVRYSQLNSISGVDGYSIKAKTDSWNPPNVGIGYQWEGYMQGTMPDTNIGQLERDIFNNIDANDINVTGEVTEADPEPTPAPTTPPAEDILEGINDIIGQLDNIKEGVGDITGSMTETIEGTAEAVGSIEGTLSDALAMPDSEELPDFKFDLRELFPFCIPFDIYNLLSRFDASPTAPHVQIPFNIASIGFNYNIDLDFSAFNSVAEIMRTVEFIVYAIGLALVTGKVIKW